MSRRPQPTDLDRSEDLYANVLGLTVPTDFGDVRVLTTGTPVSRFSLIRHPNGEGRPFTELPTGVDHIG